MSELQMAGAVELIYLVLFGEFAVAYLVGGLAVLIAFVVTFRSLNIGG